MSHLTEAGKNDGLRQDANSDLCTNVKVNDSSGYTLDLARGFAANIVVFGHLNAVLGLGFPAFPYGGVGVVLFFLMSGFLITLSVMTRIGKGGPAFSDFIADRIGRICTPFIPALVIIAVLGYFFLPVPWGSPGLNHGIAAFFGNLFFLNDYPVLQLLSNFIDVSSFYVRSYKSAEPFWTVAVEFWIYIFVGVVVFVLLRREKVKKWVWLISAISVPVVLWNSFAGGGGGLAVVWMMGAIFAILWVTLAGQELIVIRRAGGLLLCSGFLMLLGRIGKHGFDPYEIQSSIFMGMMLFGLTMWMAERHNLRVFGLLSRGLASYSYSLYLTHNSVFVIFLYAYGNISRLGVLVAYACAHAVALAVYFFFERHYHRVSRIIRKVLSRFVYR